MILPRQIPTAQRIVAEMSDEDIVSLAHVVIHHHGSSDFDIGILVAAVRTELVELLTGVVEILTEKMP